MVKALEKELVWRRDYLPNKQLDSIYLGGGTPSLLDETELQGLFETIAKHWEWNDSTEITLEANPDDLNLDRLKMLRYSPVNRLSIGIQSFAETDLQFMNRAHNSQEAKQCLDLALDQGFQNITVDLIYGSPTTSDQQWEDNIQTIIDLGIPHLSSYALTVEPQTALAHLIAKGKTQALDESQAERQFNILLQMTEDAGLEQYEISNFARNGNYAKHNTAYWQGDPYLGIGPSAHSFDGRQERRWNIANNVKYLKLIDNLSPLQTPTTWGEELGLYEKEILSLADRYNEYIMTGLRTKWGINLDHIANYGDQYLNHFQKEFNQYSDKNLFVKQQKVLKLSKQARFLADGIASSLFYTD